ncbi:MAG: hypothetical protein ACKO32_03335, partial [Planctomycetia bacterium]
MSTRIVLPVLLLASAACSRETPPPSTPKKSAAELALETQAKSIEAEIEMLRGQAFRQPVDVRVSDENGLLAYIEERRRMDTTPERDRFLEEYARLTGLIGKDL